MLISKYGNGTELQVEEFEKKYGITFNNEYRAFLIRYNGGDTPNTYFKNGKYSETVRFFFGINAKNNIEDSNCFDFKENGCIPIGMDNFGNYYAIGISESNNGFIFFCDHKSGFSNVKIAESFKEFVKRCKSKMVDDFAKKTPEEIEQIMIEKGRGNIITDTLRATWKEQYEKYKDMIQEEVVL